MDKQKIPSSGQKSGELLLEDENQVLKPPPRRKKSLRKSKMEADSSRRITASHSGKPEKEQLKTSLDDKMVKEEPLSVNVDNNNKNTVNSGKNLDSETLKLAAKQPANDAKTESKIPKSPAQNKSNNEAIEESKVGETPENFTGCKMTTIKDEVSKMQKRNTKDDNIDEVEEDEQDKMGNKNGSLKSTAKNTETGNPKKPRVIQNGNTGIKDTSKSHQATNKAVVISENFESFCLVENVAKSNGEAQAQTTEKVDQESREISLTGEKGSSQSCSEERTSGIPIPMSGNLINSDTNDSNSQNNLCVNNSPCDSHEDSVQDDSRLILQVGKDISDADKKATMRQLQRNDDNAVSDDLEIQNNISSLITSEEESQNNTKLNIQNPLCKVYNPGNKTDDKVEKEMTQKQCTAYSSLDNNVLNQDSLLPMDSVKGINQNTEKVEEEEGLFHYQNLEESSNLDDTCEGDLGDVDECSTDTDSDTYYSDFTSSEGEYDMEDAEKLCFIDEDKKEGNSPVSKEAEAESIQQILSAFQDTETVTVTDDTDGDSHHGDSSHGDGGHGNEANTGLELSEDRAQSLKRKIGSFKVVKGVEPGRDEIDVKEASVGMATELVAKETDITMDTTKTAELAILALHMEHRQKHAERKERTSFKVVKGVEPGRDEIDVKEASVGMATELVAKETDITMDTTKTAELAILALHMEHRQKHAERKERKREKRKSHEVITREKTSQKLEISRPRSLVGEPRTRSRSTGDLDNMGKPKPIAKKQNSLPVRGRRSKLDQSSSSKVDVDERVELPLFDNDNTYLPGVLKGGFISSLRHLEESRERRDSGTPVFKQSSIKRESESMMVAEVGSNSDRAEESEKNSVSNVELPSISVPKHEILESELPGEASEVTSQDLEEQRQDTEGNLTVDRLPDESLRRSLSTVREESALLENWGSFSISSRGSSISQDIKALAEEAGSVAVGSDSSSTDNMGTNECEDTPNINDDKLKEWEVKNEIWENEKSGLQTSCGGIGMTTPISIQGISKRDHELSKSAPTTFTNYTKSPSNNGDIKKPINSLENVQLRQMKITRAKRKWLSQSAVVTSGLPQSPTDVKLTSFRKNGEDDVPDSGTWDLQTPKSPDDETNHAKETTKQVTFDVTHDVTPDDVTAENVTAGEVTPKRPPRKGKLSSSASFASPRTARTGTTNKKPGKRDNGKKRDGGSRWQTLSGAIDADWLARLSSAQSKLPTEQMSDEVITLVTDAIPASFPAFPTDKRAQIALELYTTERTYVRGLEIVIELFKNQLEEYLEPKESATMFSNIEDIFKVNKDVLFSLCEKVNHWKDIQVIGDVFVENGDRFKIYATYCNNYDAAETLIKQKVKKKKEFDDFLEACYKNVVCQPGLKLPAYLITVVQRIPRYLLLLRDLVKCTPASHPDARPIKEGLRKMNNIAEYINNQLQAVQGQRAMTELRSRVIGIKAFETAGKSLIKEGEVYIMSTKRTYKCLLFNDMVVFAAKNVNKRSEVELTLELESIWVADLEDNDPQTSKEDAIELYTPERSYTMYTGTRNEKKLWLQKLRTAIAIRLHGEMATDSNEIEHRKSAFTYKDGRIYCGTFVDAKRHGHGVIAWQNRTRYVGNFEDDERNGIGELTYSTGERYNGEWLDDKQHGVGTLTYPNNDIYTGEWQRGKMNGKGLINFSNGDILDGEFVDNEVCGIARLNCVSGLTYEGQWKNSKKHGKGKLIKPNGDTFEGDFSNDRINGTGQMIYASNKAIYDGQWENNQRHGSGIYKAPDGTRYEGEWRGDHMSGRGKMMYPNGDTYEGSWYRDMRFGKGILSCQEGVYEGKFEYNVRHGYGLMRYSDKSEYEGEWQHDQRHGQGKMIYADSGIYEGNWKLGLRDGRGKMTFSNGATYEGNWDLGSEHGPDGVFIDTANNYSYEGGWEYGCKQGQGVEKTNTGTYEGDFKANMRHGKGVETLTCGTVYEGQWRDNRKVGEIIRKTKWGETETTTEVQYWKEGQLLNKDETIAPDLPFIQRITNK